MQIMGLVIGSIPLLKDLLVGDTAILRPIQDSIVLLGYVYVLAVLINLVFKSEEKSKKEKENNLTMQC
jgi:hypothetical protein